MNVLAVSNGVSWAKTAMHSETLNRERNIFFIPGKSNQLID
jgi:hypothetical protein